MSTQDWHMPFRLIFHNFLPPIFALPMGNGQKLLAKNYEKSDSKIHPPLLCRHHLAKTIKKVVVLRYVKKAYKGNVAASILN